MHTFSKFLTRQFAAAAFVCAVAALVIGPGCTEFGSFKFTSESDVTTIQGTQVPLAGPLSSLTFDFNLEQELQKRDVKAAKAVKLNKLTLQITPDEEPGDDEDNFNFLDSITFIANADGKERVELASQNDVPENARTVNVPVTSDTNLKPYIEQGLTLSTEGEGSPPEDDTSVKGIITLEVEVL